MNSGQIVLYGLVLLVLVVYLRRFLMTRGLTHYTTAEVNEKLKSGDTVLVDVRTRQEWDGGHIKGALLIPLHEIDRRKDELKPHQTKELICYCRSGNRSVIAAAKLRKHGFRSANMKGGIAEWNLR